MARAYGSSAHLLMKRETAYGQAAIGNYMRMPFNRCNLGSEQGLIDDPVLGQGRDPLAPLQDVINDEGDIVVPVDPRYLGLWLTGLFGDPTIAALTGRIDVRFADTTLIDLAADGTPVDLEFAYTLSAQSKLVLTAHEVYLPKPKLAVEGPGGVQASFDFRGAKNTGAGRMLTVTLTNDLDGLVYG